MKPEIEVLMIVCAVWWPGDHCRRGPDEKIGLMKVEYYKRTEYPGEAMRQCQLDRGHLWRWMQEQGAIGGQVECKEIKR